MSVQYRSSEQDHAILDEIEAIIEHSLNIWYGEGTRLGVDQPVIKSYRNCFMLHYPIVCPGGDKKTVLVKIRRNPKMDSLSRAVQAEIHANIPTEYASLEFVFNCLTGQQEDFGVIRPLVFIDKYHAIVMEEYPARTLRTLLLSQRFSINADGTRELVDAATKTGRWLHYFHHHIHTSEERPYSASDIIDSVTWYARRLEIDTDGRVRPQAIIQDFAKAAAHTRIDTMLFSESHADMTVDNVLYSPDGKVCVIDIKARPAPIYSDLGLILTHPETFREQILLRGAYLPQSLLRTYRESILTGYFEGQSVNHVFVELFSAMKVLDKWAMHAELLHRYRGIKRVLTRPFVPMVHAYFHGLLQRYLRAVTA